MLILHLNWFPTDEIFQDVLLYHFLIFFCPIYSTHYYYRGCAIHHTFNRAVTVHGVDNLLVENNVAYNNMGHAFFLEDGGEENNIFRGNLAIFTKTSSSLLNVDVTPGQ